MSSINQFEVSKRSIANVQFCEAYLLSVIHNLKMTIYFSKHTLKNLEILNKFVIAESIRQKNQLETNEFNQDSNIQVDLNLQLKGGELVQNIQNIDTQVIETNHTQTQLEQVQHEHIPISETTIDALNDNQNELRGGKILELETFLKKIENHEKDFQTIELLTETVNLLTMAFGYIFNNEEVALKEAEDALLNVESCLVIGVPLESKISELQFSTVPYTSDLKSFSLSIRTYNTTLSNLPSILTKLYSVVRTLMEDITDTNELVDQVRTIVFGRSSQNETVMMSVLKWFTSQSKNQIKTDMILNSLESVFSSMDLVVHYSTNASVNLKAIENKVRIYKISGVDLNSE